MESTIEEKAYSLLSCIQNLSLPVNINEIARRCRYNVKPYSSSTHLIEALGLSSYTQKYSAFSVKHNDAYFIFVSDNLTPDDERFVIAHEIGHISLSHLNAKGVFGESVSPELSSKYEADADRFALALVAPLPLLAMHNLRSPDDVKDLAHLNLQNSRKVFFNLCDSYSKHSHANEVTSMIEHYQHRKSGKNTLKQNIIVMLCCFTVMLSTSCGNQPNTQNAIENSDVSMVFSSASYDYQSDVYYWTENGKVYHSHIDCYSLARSKNIESGSLYEAKIQKERLCKICLERDAD